MERSRILALIAVCILFAPSARVAAAPSDGPCELPGQVVLTDPSGDAPNDQTDILDLAFAEPFGGTYAGKIIVTMHVTQLGTSPSGLWVMRWEDPSGQNVTNLSMNLCAGVGGASYSYQTTEGTETGAVDEISYTPEGTIQFVVSRDKIGNPGTGDEFVAISAVATAWEEFLTGCIPMLGAEGTGEGSYTLGTCVVSVPRPMPRADFSLGPAFPNPGRDGSSFALDVPEALSGLRLEAGIYDLVGRRVREIASGPIAAGRTLLRWDLRDSNGGLVPAGTYWMRLRIAGERRSRPVQVVH